MIAEFNYGLFFSFCKFLINLIPTVESLPTSWVDNTTELLSYALMFFPKDVFIAAISSIVFWMSGNLIWAIIEWVYKKIPGVS